MPVVQSTNGFRYGSACMPPMQQPASAAHTASSWRPGTQQSTKGAYAASDSMYRPQQAANGVGSTSTYMPPMQQAANGVHSTAAYRPYIQQDTNSVRPASRDMSFSSSRTWTSDTQREIARYQISINAVQRSFPRSPVSVWTFNEWLEHQAAMKDEDSYRLQQKLQARKEERRVYAETGLDAPIAFHGKKLPGQSQGAVLGCYTIWCEDFNHWKNRAPWPELPEMRWEGDDRARTGVRRFLPLPREPCHESIPWPLRRMVPQHEFDAIWKVPNMDDILYPMEQINQEVESEKHNLLSQDLLDALECEDE